MSTEGLVIGIVIFAVGAAYLMLPFLRLRSADAVTEAADQKAYDSLLNAYERVLSTMRDLDDDFNAGKLPSDAYESERADWEQQGVLVLQALETAHQPSKPVRKEKAAADSVDADAELDQAVEQVIANYAKIKHGSTTRN